MEDIKNLKSKFWYGNTFLFYLPIVITPIHVVYSPAAWPHLSIHQAETRPFSPHMFERRSFRFIENIILFIHIFVFLTFRQLWNLSFVVMANSRPMPSFVKELFALKKLQLSRRWWGIQKQNQNKVFGILDWRQKSQYRKCSKRKWRFEKGGNHFSHSIQRYPGISWESPPDQW